MPSWKLALTSVQFKMVSMHSEKPICAPPHLSEVSPALPLKRFQCSSDCWWPSLVLSGEIIKRLLFSCFSPPDSCWCDILGFVPSASVWSSPLIFLTLLQILLMLWAVQIIIIPSLVTTGGSANHHYPFPCHYCGQCKSSLSLPLSLLWAVQIIIIPSLVTTVGNANHHPLSLLWAMQIIIIPSCVTTVGNANHYPLSLLWAVQIIIPSLVTTVGNANHHYPFLCHYCGQCKSLSLVATVGSANHYPFPCHYCGQCKSLSLVTTVGNANHYPLSLLWAMQIIIIPALVTTVGNANHYPLPLPLSLPFGHWYRLDHLKTAP